MTVQEVIEEVLKDKVFYDNSEGGITLSGGEPLYQPEFALDILTKAKQEGLHTAIETSGCGKTSDYIKLIPVTDLFLWDIKVMDEELYHELVGGTLERVLENLRTLHRAGVSLRLRVLFIPGIQDQPEILSATQALLKELEGVPYDVIPYHPLGNSKREKLALEKVVFPVPSEEQVADFYRKLQFSNP
jgi:pyruvate formate lyase activating enzyme